MTTPAFIEKNDKTKLFDVTYYHDPNRWAEYFASTSAFNNEKNWSGYIKYLDDNGNISPEINNITKNHGGIYIFFIQGDTLPFCEKYIAYIGRAQLTKGQSVGKRLCEYLAESQKESSRPLISRLFKYWKDKLYVRYYQSEDNREIINGEAALIWSIMPPFNSEMPESINTKQEQKNPF